MDLDPGRDVLGAAQRAEEVAIGDARRIQLEVERLEVLGQGDVGRRPAEVEELRRFAPAVGGPDLELRAVARDRRRPGDLRLPVEHLAPDGRLLGRRQAVADEPVERGGW